MKALALLLGCFVWIVAFGSDEQTQAWINSLANQSQSAQFMENLNNDETVSHLMQHSDSHNSVLGYSSAQSLVAEAALKKDGDEMNLHLKQLQEPNGVLEKAKAQLDHQIHNRSLGNEGQNLSYSIGLMLKEQFLNGPRITLDPNEGILRHAKELSEAQMSEQGAKSMHIENPTFSDEICEENVHGYTDILKESLVIELEDGREYTQPIYLQAAAHNESFVTITANLLTGEIISAGNGQNSLHPESKVISPLGALPTGSTVVFKRSDPYGFWNSFTENVRINLGQEPSVLNGYQYFFTLQQEKYGKKHQELGHHYRGMHHHWEATINIPPAIRSEYWKGNKKLYDLEGSGHCVRMDSRCVGQPGTRLLSQGASSLSLERTCWEKETTLSCKLSDNHIDTCQVLKSKGCEQVASICKQNNKGFCILYEQHYRCPTNNTLSNVDTEFDIQALSKEGKSLVFEENKDFREALVGLSLAQSFATEQVTKDQQEGKFFGGQSQECESLPNQCCAQKGVINKILGCSEQEQALVPQIENGLCHYVGETKKGVFHQKKKHYCCFHSKLARIAQVGGRQQLGKDFGKSHAPICDGLSIEELERIQWSAIDFSEVVQDFAQKVAGTRLTSDFQQKAAEQVSDSQKSELSKLSSGLNSTIHSLQNDFPDELNQYYKEQSND